MSAIMKLTPWCIAIGMSKVTRSFAYSTASSYAACATPTAPIAAAAAPRAGAEAVAAARGAAPRTASAERLAAPQPGEGVQGEAPVLRGDVQVHEADLVRLGDHLGRMPHRDVVLGRDGPNLLG